MKRVPVTLRGMCPWAQRSDAESMEATDEQALVSALTAERPPPAGWYWQLSPHPELPGWFWASKAHPTELPAPGGVLLCGPNGRRLAMPSIPGMRGDSPVAVSVLRELGASDLSDSELKSAIYAREQGVSTEPAADQ